MKKNYLSPDVVTSEICVKSVLMQSLTSTGADVTFGDSSTFDDFFKE